MNRRTKYVILPLLILATGFSLFRLFYHSDGSEALSFSDTTVSARILTDAYDNGEAHADSVFLEKTISVRGIVNRIQRNDSGRVVATLEGRHPDKTAVECIFDSAYTADLAGLRVGDTVSIRGRCAGRSMNVIMVQCVREK